MLHPFPSIDLESLVPYLVVTDPLGMLLFRESPRSSGSPRLIRRVGAPNLSGFSDQKQEHGCKLGQGFEMFCNLVRIRMRRLGLQGYRISCVLGLGKNCDCEQ